jgi:hypothetical protein
MTPQQKAQEIYNSFLSRYEKTDTCFGLCNDINICDGTGHGCGIWKIYAKQSAIFTAEQIIFELELLRKPENTIFTPDSKTNESNDGFQRIDFWQDVINLIKTL